mgnify:FL=1
MRGESRVVVAGEPPLAEGLGEVVVDGAAVGQHLALGDELKGMRLGRRGRERGANGNNGEAAHEVSSGDRRPGRGVMLLAILHTGLIDDGRFDRRLTRHRRRPVPPAAHPADPSSVR